MNGRKPKFEARVLWAIADLSGTHPVTKDEILEVLSEYGIAPNDADMKLRKAIFRLADAGRISLTQNWKVQLTRRWV